MCTSWATIGKMNRCGGTLIAKNRDEDIERVQELKLIKPESGNCYFALIYKLHRDDPVSRFFSAGINEKGLVMLNHNPTLDHNSDENPRVGGLKENILIDYDSVKAVLEDQQKIFAHTSSSALILADEKNIALIETSPYGDCKSQEKQEGTLCHTNHYVLPEFETFNEKVSEGSRLRYARIQKLLESEKNYDVETFKRFSENTEDGTHSIFREKTMATWVAELLPNKPPKLWVKLFNPYQEKKTETFLLDKNFWQQGQA